MGWDDELRLSMATIAWTIETMHDSFSYTSRLRIQAGSMLISWNFLIKFHNEYRRVQLSSGVATRNLVEVWSSR
jgi:hypothetical protein